MSREAARIDERLVAALPSRGLRWRFRRLGRIARRKPLGAVALLVIIVLVVTAAGANVVSPYPPNEQHYEDILVSPTGSYLLGTDDLGRDLLSRIIFGARVSLFVGFFSVLIGVAHGTWWGSVSGYFGGRLDYFVQRVMDAFMAIPFLVLALTLVAMAGASLRNVIIALGFALTPATNRIVRGTVLSAKENQYVEAARVIGCGNLRTLFRHILPNVFAPIIVIATVFLGSAIIAEASLSFLGMGSPPPNTSWGSILSQSGRQFLERAPWIAIFPGAAIALVVLSFNLLGDALRDILDPRLRE